MKTFILIAAIILLMLLILSLFATIKEFIHMIKNPGYHMEALRATEIMQRGNKGEDIEDEVEVFNESCGYDITIKRTFEFWTEKGVLHTGGTYYIYEGRFEKRDLDFGGGDGGIGFFY